MTAATTTGAAPIEPAVNRSPRAAALPGQTALSAARTR